MGTDDDDEGKRIRKVGGSPPSSSTGQRLQTTKSTDNNNKTNAGGSRKVTCDRLEIAHSRASLLKNQVLRHGHSIRAHNGWTRGSAHAAHLSRIHHLFPRNSFLLCYWLSDAHPRKDIFFCVPCYKNAPLTNPPRRRDCCGLCCLGVHIFKVEQPSFFFHPIEGIDPISRYPTQSPLGAPLLLLLLLPALCWNWSWRHSTKGNAMQNTKGSTEWDRETPNSAGSPPRWRVAE